MADLSKAQLTENLLQAMKIVSDNNTNNLPYDVTIKCTILEQIYDRSNNICYRVNYNGTNLQVYPKDTNVTYKENDVVLVTVPQNNYNEKKYIAGFADIVDKNFILANDKFIPFLTIIDNIDSPIASFEHAPQNIDAYENSFEYRTAYDNIYNRKIYILSQCDSLYLSCEIKCKDNIEKENISTPYGFTITIKYDTLFDSNNETILEFNSKDFIGDIYQNKYYFKQDVIFSDLVFNGIKSIEITKSKDFDKNIEIKNLTLLAGQKVDNQTGIKIFSNANNFTYGDSDYDENFDRQLGIIYYNIIDGKFIGFNSNESIPIEDGKPDLDYFIIDEYDYATKKQEFEELSPIYQITDENNNSIYPEDTESLKIAAAVNKIEPYLNEIDNTLQKIYSSAENFMIKLENKYGRYGSKTDAVKRYLLGAGPFTDKPSKTDYPVRYIINTLMDNISSVISTKKAFQLIEDYFTLLNFIKNCQSETCNPKNLNYPYLTNTAMADLSRLFYTTGNNADELLKSNSISILSYYNYIQFSIESFIALYKEDPNAKLYDNDNKPIKFDLELETQFLKNILIELKTLFIYYRDIISIDLLRPGEILGQYDLKNLLTLKQSININKHEELADSIVFTDGEKNKLANKYFCRRWYKYQSLSDLNTYKELYDEYNKDPFNPLIQDDMKTAIGNFKNYLPDFIVEKEDIQGDFLITNTEVYEALIDKYNIISPREKFNNVFEYDSNSDNKFSLQWYIKNNDYENIDILLNESGWQNINNEEEHFLNYYNSSANDYIYSNEDKIYYLAKNYLFDNDYYNKKIELNQNKEITSIKAVLYYNHEKIGEDMITFKNNQYNPITSSSELINLHYSLTQNTYSLPLIYLVFSKGLEINKDIAISGNMCNYNKNDITLYAQFISYLTGKIITYDMFNNNKNNYSFPRVNINFIKAQQNSNNLIKISDSWLNDANFARKIQLSAISQQNGILLKDLFEFLKITLEESYDIKKTILFPISWSTNTLLSITGPKLINISTESDTIEFDSDTIDSYKVLGNSNLKNTDINIVLYKIDDEGEVTYAGGDNLLYLTKNNDYTYKLNTNIEAKNDVFNYKYLIHAYSNKSGQEFHLLQPLGVIVDNKKLYNIEL